MCVSTPFIRGKSRVREYRQHGSVRGAPGNRRLYRDFVIHPAFCEYLALDTSNQELVLTLDWDYLHDAEQTLFNTPNAFLFFGE